MKTLESSPSHYNLTLLSPTLIVSKSNEKVEELVRKFEAFGNATEV